ncbi:FitA-like ribbon-helix-helix domain-containing protein [Acidithiobacillus ferridurans]
MRAARHGRSAEAEVREILVKISPSSSVCATRRRPNR